MTEPASSNSTTVDARRALQALNSRFTRLRRVGDRRNIHWLVDGPKGRVVLRRYASDRSEEDVTYELKLLEHLDRRGWPVPVSLALPIEVSGARWCLFRYIPGRPRVPRTATGLREEQRQRGKLLARLHADMAEFASAGQRSGWRRADEGLWTRKDKPSAGDVLREFERHDPEAGRIFRTYADKAEARLAELLPLAPDPIVIHGDFAPWNIRYSKGLLAGIIDFDSAHLDLRVADFALSWRGKYSGVIEGYERVFSLQAIEKELIVPVYWAWVIASVVGGIDAGKVTAEGPQWAVTLLLRTKLEAC